jgi:hypothetical protein
VLYRRAVEVLGTKYGIGEDAAYDALVRCSEAWHMSVREAATRIVERAHLPPQLSPPSQRNGSA